MMRSKHKRVASVKPGRVISIKNYKEFLERYQLATKRSIEAIGVLEKTRKDYLTISLRKGSQASQRYALQELKKK